jgi:hypothetical protein
MGTRGPKPGWKKQRQQGAAAAPSAAPPADADTPDPQQKPEAIAAETPAQATADAIVNMAPPLVADTPVSDPVAQPVTTEQQPAAAAPARKLTAAEAANPAYLTGDDLRALAYRRGMSKSEMTGMSDERVREQLKYLTYRRHEEEQALAEA